MRARGRQFKEPELATGLGVLRGIAGDRPAQMLAFSSLCPAVYPIHTIPHYRMPVGESINRSVGYGPLEQVWA